ncbi:hypothetical protein B0I27_101467 [Arcticibacter pallidicorallinus]|uniref:Uncharacterized protein n=1 Tax=Arcticibacter pallidicorallinus TaxID=1259464 RepID=A0A2T0UC32_9SPHI|nr:hypothetical protein B0I27_101467 [Arcticibacter pallidicorallinus]
MKLHLQHIPKRYWKHLTMPNSLKASNQLDLIFLVIDILGVLPHLFFS